MHSHPCSFEIDEAVLAERNRCAEIAEHHAMAFECKRLYNSARTMKEVASAIRTHTDSAIQPTQRADPNGRDFSS